MQWFYNLKIGTKLTMGFAFVALIAAAVGYEGISSIKSADASDVLLYERNAVPLGDLGQMSSAFQRQRGNVLEFIYSTNDKERQSLLQRMADRNKEIDSLIQKVESSVTAEEVKAKIKAWKDLDTEFDQTRTNVINLSKNKQSAQAIALFKGDMDIVRTAEQTAIQNLQDMLVKRAKDRSDQNTANASAAVTAMLIFTFVGVVLAIALGYFISRLISRPLKKGVEMMSEMSKGHLQTRLNLKDADEIGMLAKSMDEFAEALQVRVVGVMKKIAEGDLSSQVDTSDPKDEIGPALKGTIESLRGLVAESATLTKAAVEGKLATRGNVDKFKGSYHEIVKGVNDTLDAVIGPLNVAAEYVDRISKGDIPPKITDNYNGDFNEIKNNLNQCIDALSGLIGEMNNMSQQHDLGDIDVAIPVAKFQGAYKEMGEGVNKMVAGHITVKKKAMACIAEFSRGNFEAQLEKFPGKKVFINDTIEQLRTNLKALIADAAVLAKAAVDGKLATRADAAKHQGDFRKIVQGVNDTLDSVIGPLNVAAEYVDRISKGDIPPKITDNYNGDFNEIKNNLNACVDTMNGLLAETNTLVKATVDGRLSVRGDSAKFAGGWGTLVGGVNNLVDAFVGPINVTAEYVDRISKGDIPPKITDNYNGDFNEIKNNLNACVDTMNGLLAETDKLVKATVEGRLSVRGDAGKFPGGWGTLVGGVNNLVDAFVGPINVTAEYVDRISKGDIPPKITDTYNGDFNEIKNNLNACVETMSSLLAETAKIVKAAADGELDKRADATKFVGGWNQLVSGVNDTITNIVNPLMVTADYVDKVSKGVIPPEITDTYKGQYNIIKNNLNAVVKMMAELLAETDKIIKAAADGEL
ncbi:MAG TPA: MCP four helix bundle domain-containing protein, partial [Bacteroidota bacterium]|nr:MCP four helix bundle domain-containing protein [Bacteroidota bacterium]